MGHKWGFALGMLLGVGILSAYNQTPVKQENRSGQIEPSQGKAELDHERTPAATADPAANGEAAALRAPPVAFSSDPQFIDQLVAQALKAGDIDPSQAKEYREGLEFEAETLQDQATEELVEEF